MKITTDRERCNGHGQCELYAGDVFEIDDEGYIRQLRPVNSADPGELAAVRTAAERCPERVITLMPEAGDAAEN